jgi:hypothetical protein
MGQELLRINEFPSFFYFSNLRQINELEVATITLMRPKSHLRAQERERKQKWYMQVMGKLQHLSIAMRPQTVRAMWVRDVALKEEERARQ